jgi:uncharacterized RDD family membrane protein YckC
MNGLDYLEKNPVPPMVELKVRYAGFWIRLVAQIIDSIIFYIISFIPSFMFGFLSAAVFNFKLTTPAYIAIGIISVMLYWLYQSLFISSKYMATPGKMVVGIKVTDLEGNRISFSRATLRYLFKNGIGDLGNILGYILIWLNVLLIFTLVSPLFMPFNVKKQALHDMLAGTLVVYK